jgi:type I restriction enzyme R subunit
MLWRGSSGRVKKKGRVPKNDSIFFTIFQTFTQWPDADASPLHISATITPDFFDLHHHRRMPSRRREDESEWRAILEYFAPAVQIGLTATPKRRTTADTYAYFGEPFTPTR